MVLGPRFTAVRLAPRDAKGVPWHVGLDSGPLAGAWAWFEGRGLAGCCQSGSGGEAQEPPLSG